MFKNLGFYSNFWAPKHASKFKAWNQLFFLHLLRVSKQSKSFKAAISHHFELSRSKLEKQGSVAFNLLCLLHPFFASNFLPYQASKSPQVAYQLIACGILEDQQQDLWIHLSSSLRASPESESCRIENVVYEFSLDQEMLPLSQRVNHNIKFLVIGTPLPSCIT